MNKLDILLDSDELNRNQKLIVRKMINYTFQGSSFIYRHKDNVNQRHYDYYREDRYQAVIGGYKHVMFCLIFFLSKQNKYKAVEFKSQLETLKSTDADNYFSQLPLKSHSQVLFRLLNKFS